MRLVHCSCVGLRRVCAPARTGSNRQFSHFRRNLSAPVYLLLRRSSAGCVRCVAISRRTQDVTIPARIFNMFAYLPASSARRNRTQSAQPTHLGDELTRRWCFLSKTVRAESIASGAACKVDPMIATFMS